MEESNIAVEFTGFREQDEYTVSMVKNNVMKHLHRLGEICRKADKLHITMKTVHEREKGELYEVHAHFHEPGMTYSSVCVDRNLMVAVDKVIERVISEVQHKNH